MNSPILLLRLRAQGKNPSRATSVSTSQTLSLSRIWLRHGPLPSLVHLARSSLADLDHTHAQGCATQECKKAGQTARLFLPVLPGSFPFPTFDLSPDHPVTSIVQSPNSLGQSPNIPWEPPQETLGILCIGPVSTHTFPESFCCGTPMRGVPQRCEP